jgi:hypothetical protein
MMAVKVSPKDVLLAVSECASLTPTCCIMPIPLTVRSSAEAGVCRAINCMNAEMFRPFAQRMTPVAVVPMFTPPEAIAEAEYAVEELGMKAIMIANHVRRPIRAHLRTASDPTTVGSYIDFLSRHSTNSPHVSSIIRWTILLPQE